jgi:hypothetical protein
MHFLHLVVLRRRVKTLRKRSFLHATSNKLLLIISCRKMKQKGQTKWPNSAILPGYLDKNVTMKIRPKYYCTTGISAF